MVFRRYLLTALVLVPWIGACARTATQSSHECDAVSNPCPVGYACVASDDGRTQLCIPIGQSDDGDTTAEGVVSVEPLYANGRNWNDYVANDGTDRFSASDEPCQVPSLATADACLHAGELRKVVVEGVSSCAGLTLAEDLGVFDWQCRDSGGTATFLTSGLRAGRGLRDLVTGSGFKANSLVISNAAGDTVGHSEPAIWGWQNPIVPLASSTTEVTILDQAETIYVLTSDTTSLGYSVTADKVALVTSDSAIQQVSTTVDNCNLATGTTADPDAVCLLAAGAHNFLWIEADLGDPYGADSAMILIANVAVSRVHGSTLTGSSGSQNCLYVKSGATANRIDVVTTRNCQRGLVVESSDGNAIANAQARGHSDTAVNLTNITKSEIRSVVIEGAAIALYLGASHDNRIVDVVSNHSGIAGVQVSESSYNILSHVSVGQTSEAGAYEGRGLVVFHGVGNIVTDVVSSANAELGVLFQDTDDATISHVTSVNNQTGLFAQGCERITIAQALLANQRDAGLAIDAIDAIDGKYANVFSADNGSTATGNREVTITNGNNHAFSANLWVGPTGCYIDAAATNTGLADATCAPQAPSTATLVNARSSAAVFVGKVTSDDITNTSDASGTLTFDAISDWLGFDSWFRSWGNDGSAFPARDNDNDCRSASVCRIWDWRLRSDDTQARNVIGAHGSTCTSTADALITDAANRTFLINALEIFDDGIGNDNGLCETYEACVHSPNVGAYQGEGVLIGPTTYDCGNVTGVALYDYSQNGVP